MMGLEGFLSILGNTLSVLFLWKLRAHFHRYPFLLIYVLPTAARSSVTAYRYWNSVPYTDEYLLFYWTTSSVLAALRLFVAWEVLRQVIPRGHALSSLARAASLCFLVAMSLFLWILGPEGDIFDDTERKLSLTCAIWIASTLALASFYRIAISRPVFAMAMGLGIFVTVSLINTSAVAMVPDFYGTWSYVKQIDYSLVLAIWLWGFWRPPDDSHSSPSPGSHALEGWVARWNDVRRSIRSVWKR